MPGVHVSLVQARKLDAASATRVPMWAKHGVLLATLAGAAAAIPGLWVPFLADDWLNLSAVAQRQFLRSPFGYFRPLYLATYWLDWTMWGLDPFFFHLTSILLLGAAAGLAVVMMKRYAQDDRLAAMTGILFAIHPYHFHNAAWVAARADTLCAVLLFGAAIAHHSWARKHVGIPLVSMILFEGSLLAKEAGAAFPLILTLVFLSMRDRDSRAAWMRALLPFYAIALVHFLIIRPMALHELGLSRVAGVNPTWIWKLLGFSAAAVVPVPIDLLEASPGLWGVVATTLASILAIIYVMHRPSSSRLMMLAGASFILFLAPSLIAFQERYFLLSSLATALILSCVLVSATRWGRAGVLAGVLLVWIPCLAWQWTAWLQAGAASKSLIAGLVEASKDHGVQEIVLVNLPYRVSGPPVVGDLEKAITLMGGRKVRVCAATSIDYRHANEETLDTSAVNPIRTADMYTEVALATSEGLFSRIDETTTDCASVSRSKDASLLVRLDRRVDGSRAALLWNHGSVTRLF